MGNQTGRESHGTTGSPLDFYQTPPTTPSEADLAAMALSSAASSSKAQTPSPAGSTAPSTSSPLAEWTRKLSAPSEWAVISVDSISSQTNVSDAALRQHGGGSGQPHLAAPVQRITLRAQLAGEGQRSGAAGRSREE
ncbi:hypothetical protein OYC64_004936 [Pagothenia borchgrevinki]|uniref:Uncharacterized protein n=1 Tax=Pagothenia borchgrevinki TaxID=8213 RepID=A0ABD2GDZ7_PAGBO